MHTNNPIESFDIQIQFLNVDVQKKRIVTLFLHFNKEGKHLKKRVSSYDTNSLISSISSSDNLFSISKSSTSASNSNPSKSL